MCSLFNQAGIGQVGQMLVGSERGRFQDWPVTYGTDVPVILGVK